MAVNRRAEFYKFTIMMFMADIRVAVNQVLYFTTLKFMAGIGVADDRESCSHNYNIGVYG